MTVTAISGPTRHGPAGADTSPCRADTHLLGKTRVMPPSVAAKTAKRLYLQGEGPGTPAISGFCSAPPSTAHPNPHLSQDSAAHPGPSPLHLRVEVLVLPDLVHQLLCDTRVQY